MIRQQADIPMNAQMQFYIENQINAVAFGAELKQHWKQRANLIESHLGIPLSLMKEIKVLEFGPCGAENALFLALNGAKVTLVEPNKAMHEQIKKLFKGVPLQGLYDETIETFETDITFDIVIAEGFLNALPNRKSTYEKIFSFSRSLSIITYSCVYGNFFESLKRYIFARYYLAYSEDIIDLSSKVKLAKGLFFDDFKKLNSARTFESWALDILINPAGNSSILDDFEDLYAHFTGLNMEIKGFSPDWDARNSHKWYKDVSDCSLIEEWRKNLSFIITGRKDVTLPAVDIKILATITPLLLNYSCNLDNTLLSIIQDRINSLSSHFDDVKMIFKAAAGSNAREIKDSYLSLPTCRYWGMPHHYLLLSKKEFA